MHRLVLAAQDRPVGQGVNFYSLAKEQALGAQLAEEMNKQVTKVATVAVEEYVDRVGQRLAAESPGDRATTYRFTVIIEHQGENPTHEPVALPAGYIFVSSSLILAAQDESEFAGMLAHAIAHVAARHGTRLATRREIASMARTPIITMIGTGDSVSPAFAKFQRAFESEADFLAVQMMARAGYDPNALVRYVARVQPADLGQPMYLSPLPQRDQRVQNLEVAIGKLNFSPGATNSEEFQRIQNAVRPAPPSLR